MRLVLATAALLAASCGRDGRDPGAAEQRAAALADVGPVRAGSPVEPAFHLLGIDLIDAGAEPRRPLRYRRPGGPIRATATAAINPSAGPGAGPADTVHTGVVVTPRRDGRYDVAGLPGEAAGEAALARYRELVAGAAAIAEIDDRGRLRAMTGGRSPDSERELAAALIRHLLPLPDEPVGDGARWCVRYAIGRGGVFVARRLELELSVAGDRMEVAITITESAEPQPIVEAGRRVADLVALQSRGRGRVELDLGSPIIARGTMTAETTFHARAGRAELLRESTTELSLTGVVREAGP